MPEEVKVDGVLEQVLQTGYGYTGVLVEDDGKGRWPKGTRIWTSMTKSTELLENGNTRLFTLNSTYDLVGEIKPYGE